MAELVIAKSIKEAASLMEEGYVVLAGGTEINRLDSSVKATSLVSLGRIPGLDAVKLTVLKGRSFLRIGAMCTFQEAIDNDQVPQFFKDACLFMSSRTRRNMATVGGNVACLRDDSYILSVLLACDASLEVMYWDKKKVISCEDYVCTADWWPYMILSVLLPLDRTVASKRFSNTAASHGYITASVCKVDGGVRIGLCLKNTGLFICDRVEDLKKIHFKDDMFGSKEYKSYILDVAVKDLAEQVCADKTEAGV